MINAFGQPVLAADVLGVVRDSAGFDTGFRVRDTGFGVTRLVAAGEFNTGLTLRNDRVFDQFNQPTAFQVIRNRF